MNVQRLFACPPVFRALACGGSAATIESGGGRRATLRCPRPAEAGTLSDEADEASVTTSNEAAFEGWSSADVEPPSCTYEITS